MQIKIIDNRGYILKGSIGIGFGAWGRATWLRDTFELVDYPTAVQPDVWDSIDVEPTPIEWVHCRRDEQGRWFHIGFKN